MKKSEFALIVLVILLLAVTVVQAFQVSNLNAKATAIATGNFRVVGSDGAAYSSYDEMMAEHHGGEAATPTSQGIGGCS